MSWPYELSEPSTTPEKAEPMSSYHYPQEVRDAHAEAERKVREALAERQKLQDATLEVDERISALLESQQL